MSKFCFFEDCSLINCDFIMVLTNEGVVFGVLKIYLKDIFVVWGELEKRKCFSKLKFKVELND